MSFYFVKLLTHKHTTSISTFKFTTSILNLLLLKSFDRFQNTLKTFFLFVNYLLSIRLGIPLVVIIGKMASDPVDPKFELHFMQDGKECHLTLNDLVTEITKYSQDKLKED